MHEIGHNGGPAIDDDKQSSGWVKIYRDIREHPVVGFGQPVKPADPSRGAYSRGEAFQDLLMEAQYKPGTTRINGETITIDVGQLVAARSYLAFRWNWSEQTVRTFLAHLVRAEIIKINQLSNQRPGASRKSAANAITLCNYEKYQAYSDAVTAYVATLKPPAEQPPDQPANNQLATSQPPAGNQNLRKEESKNINTPLPPKGGDDPRAGLGRKLARQAFDEWRELAQRLDLPTPRPESFTDARARAIFARMKEHGGTHPTPESMIGIWQLALRNVERSKFLRGMTDKGFRADLTFLCQAKSFARLIEGGYGNGAHAADSEPDNSEMLEELAAARRVTEGDYG
jgi:hypothetical protein